MTETGDVIYEAEKDACRVFPDPESPELARGPSRNFQILDPLDFVAEFTQHIPPKGAHLVRYYGWYSNKARGMRRKQAAAAAKARRESGGGEPSSAVQPSPSRASQTWAMLIKRVYEVDPLQCPKCGGEMKVIAFIEPRAPERSDGRADVIEKILKHCGLWRESSPRPPPKEEGLVYVPDDEGDGWSDLDFVPDPDWEHEPLSSDVPWEAACDAYGDSFGSSF